MEHFELEKVQEVDRRGIPQSPAGLGRRGLRHRDGPIHRKHRVGCNENGTTTHADIYLAWHSNSSQVAKSLVIHIRIH